jgi:1,5-anhydro-D-fructose reductase (1,5-anhydro-D-mannitol-forming)
MRIRLGFIGAGLIGTERVRAVARLLKAGYPLRPVGLLDPYAPQAAAAGLAALVNMPVCQDIAALLARRPDWVVVAVPHDVAPQLAGEVLKAGGAKVLIEKPLGRDLAEAEQVIASAPANALWVGQNYRFYAGIAALLADMKEGRFGAITSMSLQLGHGGGPKDIGTWKLDPVRAGGGVLIDPGIHLLDLINCIEDEPPDFVGGACWSGFWQAGIEEDVHLLLKGRKVPVFDVQVSLVRWRSLCRIEVHGLEGYGIVEGRGRSYGPQHYRRGPRWGWQTHASQADSEETVVETDGDDVFVEELRMLLFGEAGIPGAKPCSTDEALRNMRLLDALRAKLGLPSPPKQQQHR